MPIIAKKNEGKVYDQLPEGAYPARIYQIIDVGTVVGFQGAMQHKVRLTWEFPTETKIFKEENGEQPYVLSNEYTLSFHEKSQLRKVIDACDPKALKAIGDDGLVENYDIENLLGKACLVTVIHKDSKTSDATYANIGNCTVMPKGMVCPPAMNEPKVLSYDNFDMEFFRSLPAFMREKIESSAEYVWMTADKSETSVPFGKSLTEDDGLEHLEM